MGFFKISVTWDLFTRDSATVSITSLVTCNFTLLTCNFTLLTCNCTLVTCNCTLVTCNFTLVTCNFTLVICNFTLVTCEGWVLAKLYFVRIFLLFSLLNFSLS